MDVYTTVRGCTTVVGRGNVGKGGGRNIGLHNLFRLYIDGGKSDASRALYLFEGMVGYGREDGREDGTLGKPRQLIFHPMYADPPFRNDRPPSIRAICYRIRHSRNSLMKPTHLLTSVPPSSIVPLFTTIRVRNNIARRDERKVYSRHVSPDAISNETRGGGEGIATRWPTKRPTVNFQYYTVCVSLFERDIFRSMSLRGR